MKNIVIAIIKIILALQLTPTTAVTSGQYGVPRGTYGMTREKELRVRNQFRRACAHSLGVRPNYLNRCVNILLSQEHQIGKLVADKMNDLKAVHALDISEIKEELTLAKMDRDRCLTVQEKTIQDCKLVRTAFTEAREVNRKLLAERKNCRSRNSDRYKRYTRRVSSVARLAKECGSELSTCMSKNDLCMVGSVWDFFFLILILFFVQKTTQTRTPSPWKTQLN